MLLTRICRNLEQLIVHNMDGESSYDYFESIEQKKDLILNEMDLLMERPCRRIEHNPILDERVIFRNVD